MKKALSITLRFMGIYWQVASQYRLGSLIWIVNGMISPLILMGVWLVVSGSRTLALNQPQIVTYYLLTTIVIRLTQSWVAEDLTYIIREGRLSNYLLKPISFIYERIAKDQTYRLIRLISLIPFIMLAIIFNPFTLHISTQLSAWILFLLCIILGIIANFLIEVLVGLTTFWLGHAYGAFMLLFIVQELLSGVIVPFSLMPGWLQQLASWSPFYIQIGLPIDVLMGNKSFSQALPFLLIVIAWIGILALANVITYKKLIKLYTAVGN